MPPKKGGLAKAPAGKKGKAAAPKEGGRAVGHPFTVPAYGNLRLQLHALGLRIVSVEGDGNCFFRSMCDQLDGKNGDFKKLRAEVVDFIETHEVDFAPFVEDDVAFGKYVARMRGDGAWAGNIELQAASLLKRVNVCIHQHGQPPWVVANWPGEACVHLAYEGELHYDSVRRVGDVSAGPGGPFPLGAAPQSSAEDAAAGEEGELPAGLDEVLRGIPAACASRAEAAEALANLEGDVAAAIEFLIEAWNSGAGGGGGAAEEEADSNVLPGTNGSGGGRGGDGGGGEAPGGADERATAAGDGGGGDLGGEARPARGAEDGANDECVVSTQGIGSNSDSDVGGASPPGMEGAGGGKGAGAESLTAAGGTEEPGGKALSARSALLERKKARKEEKELAKQRRATNAGRRAAGGEQEKKPSSELTAEEQAELVARSLIAVRI